MSKIDTKKLNVGEFIEMRVDQNGKVRIGFGNNQGGVYVEMDTVPEMAFERAKEYANFILEQPEQYTEWCEYHGVNPENLDDNVIDYIRTKEIKRELQRIFPEKKEEKKDLKVVEK